MPTDTAPAPVLRSGPAQELSANPTYLEAVGAALDHEMERDPDVFIIGEDVGQFGGAFKVTKGFLDKYGPRRVVDTPIAETGFTGLAAGASLVGLRPVVEFQFADFISCAFDPIINVLARHHWRTGDPMPVTMRAPFGGRLRAGPTHACALTKKGEVHCWGDNRARQIDQGAPMVSRLPLLVAVAGKKPDP